jgi:hypothetical protein
VEFRFKILMIMKMGHKYKRGTVEWGNQSGEGGEELQSTSHVYLRI